MFRGTPNRNGRAKGSQNKTTKQLKEVLSMVTDELINSIQLEALNNSDKIKLLIGVLPYITPKQLQSEITQSSTNEWINNFTEDELEVLLKNTK